MSNSIWSSGGEWGPSLIEKDGRFYFCSASEQIEITKEQLDELSLFLRSRSKLGVRFIGETGDLKLTQGHL